VSPGSGLDELLRDGHYAAKQIFCRDRLIAWSHRRRFETGLELARRFRGQRLLDYGCGDGTFLAMLEASGAASAEAIGAELDAFQVTDCRRRLRSTGVRFVEIPELDAPEHRERYDVIMCMEVLEHVVDLDAVIDRLWRLLAAGGTLMVSVPVETGLPLVLKQVARRIAGWRGIGDYPGTSPYTPAEYRVSVFAGSRQHLDRPVYAGATPYHDHKGFNWMALADRLRRRFVIDETIASPIAWLGPRLATQVWFVARKRANC
jgi:SAM-dependent methyltransferase